MMENEKLLTVKDVAERLRVGVATVQRWAKRGELPMVKIGKGYRISEGELARWLGKKKGY